MHTNKPDWVKPLGYLIGAVVILNLGWFTATPVEGDGAKQATYQPLQPAATIIVGASRQEELSYRIAYCNNRTDFSAILDTVTKDGTKSFQSTAWCWQ